MEEKPSRSPRQDEGRQHSVQQCGADTSGASMSESCRRPTCRRGGDPEANKENEAGESIGHGHEARAFSLTGSGVQLRRSP